MNNITYDNILPGIKEATNEKSNIFSDLKSNTKDNILSPLDKGTPLRVKPDRMDITPQNNDPDSAAVTPSPDKVRMQPEETGVNKMYDRSQKWVKQN